MAKNSFADQSRWNRIGAEYLITLKKNPHKYLIIENPLNRQPQLSKIFNENIKKVRNKKILEIGCGRGEMSVYFAKKGAKVFGLDVGPSLIDSARALAKINQVKCKFLVFDCTRLPFDQDYFDLVFVNDVLHHLSSPAMKKTIAEIYRVLARGGIAFINEPVEDSQIFDFFQNIIPLKQTGFGSKRPSILNRKKWEEYIAGMDHHSLNTRELVSLFAKFKRIKLLQYGFINRLERIFPNKSQILNRIDNNLLRRSAYLKKFCRSAVLIAQK